MASTTITDAVVFAQDDGTGVADGSESFASAGYLGLLASHVGGEYKEGMGLSALDTTNETVDVAAGHCFVEDSGNTVQSEAGGGTYDTTLPSGSNMVYLVVFPTDETVDLDADTDASLRVVVDPTSPDTVTVEHNTSPTNPALEIGAADSTDGGNGTSEGETISPTLGQLPRLTDVGTNTSDFSFLDSGGRHALGSDGTGPVFRLESAGGGYIRFVSKVNLNGNTLEMVSGDIIELNTLGLNVQDVRNISSPSEGDYADHDGSGTNTEGLARYDGTDWISQVDGSTIN